MTMRYSVKKCILNTYYGWVFAIVKGYTRDKGHSHIKPRKRISTRAMGGEC
jgi:hypothetical protein